MPAKLITEGRKFIWKGGYKTKDIPKAAGFRWDPGVKRWWTVDVQAARKLFDFADAATRAEIGTPEVPTWFTAEVAEDVHTALHFLAARCDYAYKLDGQGFSKADAVIGHSLAEKERISRNQALLALRIVRIHHHQIPAGLWAAIKPAADTAELLREK